MLLNTLSPVREDEPAIDLRLPRRELVCGGRVIPYAVYPSARVRRGIGLRFSPATGLVAVVPKRAGVHAHVEPFLRTHQGWIVRTLERSARRDGTTPLRWPYGATLPYLGREHAVEVQRTDGPQEVTRVPDRALVVRMQRTGLEGALRLLRRWYQQEAERHLLERVAVIGREVRVRWRKVRVRNLRGAWGRCTATGHLSFQYRLMMAPPEIVDSMVWHELTHLRELNHSKRFWALLRTHCSSHEASARWLKRYGPSLRV